MAFSTGASRQLINVLNHSCPSMSFTTLSKIIKTISDRAIEEARWVASRPHALGKLQWINIR
jgi:hypothetical protein